MFFSEMSREIKEIWKIAVAMAYTYRVFHHREEEEGSDVTKAVNVLMDDSECLPEVFGPLQHQVTSFICIDCRGEGTRREQLRASQVGSGSCAGLQRQLSVPSSSLGGFSRLTCRGSIVDS